MRLKELQSYQRYYLLDPRRKVPKIFYVGVTTQPLSYRLNQHISETKAGLGGAKKLKRLKAILKAKKRPLIVGAGKAGPKQWERMERSGIKELRKYGVELTNTADGGRGQRGTHHTAEVRRRIAASVSRARAAQRDNVKTQ
jgi:predicted GIY-YIG superfamily endonuclease